MIIGSHFEPHHLAAIEISNFGLGDAWHLRFQRHWLHEFYSTPY